MRNRTFEVTFGDHHPGQIHGSLNATISPRGDDIHFTCVIRSLNTNEVLAENYALTETEVFTFLLEHQDY